MIRIPQYMGFIEAGQIDPRATMEIERESPSHALINGNWGFGHVIAQRSMSLAIQKARSSTVSAVSIYNCNHIGRIGSYAMMAAKAGLIGIVMVNAEGAALYVCNVSVVATDDLQLIPLRLLPQRGVMSL